MTLIYQVDEEVYLSAPREVLDEVVSCIEYTMNQGHYGKDKRMTDHLICFSNSLRAHAQHVPSAKVTPVVEQVTPDTQGWLDV